MVLRLMESQDASAGAVARWLSANPPAVETPEVPEGPAAMRASELGGKPADKAQPRDKPAQPGSKKSEAQKEEAPGAAKKPPSEPTVMVVHLSPLPAQDGEAKLEGVAAASDTEEEAPAPILAESVADKAVAEPVAPPEPEAEAAEHQRFFLPWENSADPLMGQDDARPLWLPIDKRQTLRTLHFGRGVALAALTAAAVLVSLMLWQWDPGSTSPSTSVAARASVEPRPTSPAPDHDATESAQPLLDPDEEATTAEPTDDPSVDPEVTASPPAAEPEPESGVLGQSETSLRRQGSARDGLSPQQVAAVQAAIDTAVARLAAEKAVTTPGSPQAALVAQQEAVLRQLARRYDLRFSGTTN